MTLKKKKIDVPIFSQKENELDNLPFTYIFILPDSYSLKDSIVSILCTLDISALVSLNSSSSGNSDLLVTSVCLLSAITGPVSVSGASEALVSCL